MSHRRSEEVQDKGNAVQSKKIVNSTRGFSQFRVSKVKNGIADQGSEKMGDGKAAVRKRLNSYARGERSVVGGFQ